MAECYQAVSIVQHSLAHTEDFFSLQPLWDRDQEFFKRLRTDPYFMYVYECMLYSKVKYVTTPKMALTAQTILNAVTNRGLFIIEQNRLFQSFSGRLPESERYVTELMVKREAVAAMIMMKHFADYDEVKPILQGVCDILL
jgi:hypothetical protein